jgi:hypothetical protein
MAARIILKQIKSVFMNKDEIGLAVISYDESGKLQAAGFQPTMTMQLDAELFKPLSSVAGRGLEDIRLNADLVMAAWFNRMNEIELADRGLYEISSEVVECLKYENGQVKQCKLRYFLKESTEKLN